MTIHRECVDRPTPGWRGENHPPRGLPEEQDGGTRLISRNRYRLPTLVARTAMLPMEPASLAMETKMLRGIRDRAERLAPDPP
jgi:hypothetical protein